MKKQPFVQVFTFLSLLFILVGDCTPQKSVRPELLSMVTADEQTGLKQKTNTAASGDTGTSPDNYRVDFNDVNGRTPELYGSNGWWSDQDAEIWKERYATLGASIIRIPAAQSLFEPVNDDDDPHHINADGFMFGKPLPWEGRTVTLAKWLNMLRDLNTAIMLNIPYLPEWNSKNADNGISSPYPPESLDEYEEYVTALLQFVVKDVGYDPKKVILEPVNEPDLGCSQDAVVACFWYDWSGEDLVNVLTVARKAAKSISSEIMVVGVSECCGTIVADRLVSTYNGQALLDGFTYHKYIPDSNFEQGISWGKHLQEYGKPVFINEFGNTTYWSNGREGALWHAKVLPELFASGIQPLQFPISHFPGSHEGFDNLGLFKDWRDNWQIKPSFWVYSNFYRYFGNAEILREITPLPVPILSVRRQVSEKPRIAIWVNVPDQTISPITFVLENFPAKNVLVTVVDNLEGNRPIDQVVLENQPYKFTFSPQRLNSYSIIVMDGFANYLPIVVN